ncbi:hypothetical protein C8J57DRAFT_1447772 [Mycena rebaudengoi]|nr:hypothetical protein C8J57DRAFT_1447772 [Mycena rebaudengoi]
MCGTGPKWKREVVQDHKFDFISVQDFRDNGFKMRCKYIFLFLIFFKSFAVYISDIFTAITMLTTKTWSNQIFADCNAKSGCVPIPFDVGKWLFVGCIIFSFLLLGYESRKAKLIVASHDISYAFTNVLANNYYSLRSYDHFCFFDHISNSTKTSDDFAFFVFFVFKSWKRVLLADGPRQVINALTLYAVWVSKHDKAGWDIPKYFIGNEISTSLLTVTTFFTVVVFAGSLLLLIVAGICYIPLLCYIRGNLKEYCCHKVDKRIETVIKKAQKKRLDENNKQLMKEARGDFSHLKNRKGEFTSKPLPQPTLPNLSMIDPCTPEFAPSTYTQDSHYYYNSDAKSNPPPMPAYNPYSTQQPPGAYATFNPSQATLPHEDYQPYEDESSMNLTAGAAPFSHAQYPIDRPGSAGPNPYYGQRDPNYPQYPIDRPGSAAPNPYYEQRNQNYSQYPIDRPGSAAPSQYSQSQYPIDRAGSTAPQYSQHPIDRAGSTPPNQYYAAGGNYDPQDVYQGRAVPSPRPGQQRGPSSGLSRPVSGLAYDESDAYGGYSASPQQPQYPQHQQHPSQGRGQGGYPV